MIIHKDTSSYGTAGANRLKASLILDKRDVSDELKEDQNFIELVQN